MASPQNRLSEQRKEIIKKLYAEGRSQEEIAQRMGTSRTTVSSIVKKKKEIGNV